MTNQADRSREILADAFDRETDPLKRYEPTFSQIDVDPFEMFYSEILEANNNAEGTKTAYRRLFEQWRNHMQSEGRHPACPNEQHVRLFAEHCLEHRNNQPDTVRTKLRRLSGVFEYWQSDTVFPHPQDFNPFEQVTSKMDLRRPAQKEPPRIPVPTLREILEAVTHIRDWLVIGSQLKLGLRASELCNLQLQDINLDHDELNRFYPDLGTHPEVSDRPNAVYVATREERDKNKSRNPRVLPLDEELQSAVTRYLLTRPDSGAPWVILSHTTHSQVSQEYVNSTWRDVFRPEYDETAEHRAVTSHFGRHRFTTYWRVEQDLNRELVKYMRGDTPQDASNGGRDAIDEYLHTYYEDIESIYRERIFSLGLNDPTTPGY
ncbi:site-specific integrase [Natronomonas gomsonensis]|nr:site-specific integrase [Natronomonas gomsonensis]